MNLTLWFLFVLLQSQNSVFGSSISARGKLSGSVQQRSSGCGDDSWAAYGSKCYKLIKKYSSWRDALTQCQQLSDDIPVSLAIINSQEENDHVAHYVYTEMGCTNQIWTGLVRNVTGGYFTWANGKQLDYTNWGAGSPSSDLSALRDCGQMNSGYGKSTPVQGQWKDVSCDQGNWVVCEKQQYLNTDDMQAILIDLMDKYEYLRDNPVPMGFIYTQYSGQPDPTELWPQCSWEDVTSVYGSAFFRAEGEYSAPFGQVQQQESPRVDRVTWNDYDGSPITADFRYPGESGSCHIGRYLYSQDTVNPSDTMGISFTTSGSNVVPMNQAIKMYKRVEAAPSARIK